MKNMRLYLIDELWANNESDKKTLIHALKDEKIIKALNSDPEKDEILFHLANPLKFKPNIS